MKKHLAHVALVVDDYDRAIDFYSMALDFMLIEDTDLGQGKRWVTMAPPGATECSLLIAKASTDNQKKHIGNQTGGRVFLFLFTDDLWRDYKKLRSLEVVFVREPVEEPHGLVAVFKDVFGNLWDLIQPSQENKGRLT